MSVSKGQGDNAHPGRRCGLVVQRANSFTGGRAFDPEPRHPLSHSRDRVLHPSSGIWLAGSVRFSTWLDWFRKIGHLAKNGGGTARTRSTKKKKKKKNQHLFVKKKKKITNRYKAHHTTPSLLFPPSRNFHSTPSQNTSPSLPSTKAATRIRFCTTGDDDGG